MSLISSNPPSQLGELSVATVLSLERRLQIHREVKRLAQGRSWNLNAVQRAPEPLSLIPAPAVVPATQQAFHTVW